MDLLGLITIRRWQSEILLGSKLVASPRAASKSWWMHHLADLCEEQPQLLSHFHLHTAWGHISWRFCTAAGVCTHLFSRVDWPNISSASAATCRRWSSLSSPLSLLAKVFLGCLSEVVTKGLPAVIHCPISKPLLYIEALEQIFRILKFPRSLATINCPILLARQGQACCGPVLAVHWQVSWRLDNCGPMRVQLQPRSLGP